MENIITGIDWESEERQEELKSFKDRFFCIAKDFYSDQIQHEPKNTLENIFDDEEDFNYDKYISCIDRYNDKGIAES